MKATTNDNNNPKEKKNPSNIPKPARARSSSPTGPLCLRSNMSKNHARSGKKRVRSALRAAYIRLVPSLQRVVHGSITKGSIEAVGKSFD